MSRKSQRLFSTIKIKSCRETWNLITLIDPFFFFYVYKCCVEILKLHCSNINVAL